MKQQSTDFRSQQVRINSDIKSGEFSHFYLLCGEQAYLRIQNRDKLKKALLGGESGESDMNYSRFAGNGFEIRQVLSIADTMPFFADRRVILLENTELFSSSDAGGDELAAYLENIPESTFFIMSEPAVDKRKKLYKAIEAHGAVLDCDSVSEEDIGSWAAGLFRKASLAIAPADLAMFLSYTGTDMMNILTEQEKLAGYCAAKQAGEDGRITVTREDIKAVITPQIKDRIFDMIEAIAARDRKSAFAIYADLCRLQTAPQAILSLMQRQFSQLLQVREMAQAGISDREIAAALKLPPFVVSGKYKKNLGKYKADELKTALSSCLAADSAYKSGKIDAGIAIEMIIIQNT